MTKTGYTNISSFSSTLEKLVAEKGGTVEGIKAKVGEACADWLEKEFRRKLEPHRSKINKAGYIHAADFIRRRKVQNGVEVGVFCDEKYTPAELQALLHSRFQEYGTPTFTKDPWFRPAMNKLKNGQFKKIGDTIAQDLVNG